MNAITSYGFSFSGILPTSSSKSSSMSSSSSGVLFLARGPNLGPPTLMAGLWTFNFARSLVIGSTMESLSWWTSSWRYFSYPLLNSYAPTASRASLSDKKGTQHVSLGVASCHSTRYSICPWRTLLLIICLITYRYFPGGRGSSLYLLVSSSSSRFI